MTGRQIIEVIQEYFPREGDTKLLKELQQIYRMFCYETRLLEGELDLLTRSIDTEDDLNLTGVASELAQFPAVEPEIVLEMERSNVVSTYALPAEVALVKEIRLLGTDGNELTDLSATIFWSEELGRITLLDKQKKLITTLPDTVDRLMIVFIRYPVRLDTALDAELEIPEEFHGAIVDKKFEQLYAHTEPRKAVYFAIEYKDKRKAAKIQANTSRTINDYNVKPYYF